MNSPRMKWTVGRRLAAGFAAVTADLRRRPRRRPEPVRVRGRRLARRDRLGPRGRPAPTPGCAAPSSRWPPRRSTSPRAPRATRPSGRPGSRCPTAGAAAVDALHDPSSARSRRPRTRPTTATTPPSTRALPGRRAPATRAPPSAALRRPTPRPRAARRAAPTSRLRHQPGAPTTSPHAEGGRARRALRRPRRGPRRRPPRRRHRARHHAPRRPPAVAVVARAPGHAARHCVTGLDGGLSALATGDLTVDGRAAHGADRRPGAATRSATSPAPFNAIQAQDRRVAPRLRRIARGLAALIGDVSGRRGPSRAASQQMATTSDEAGRAVGEIAAAVGEVAQGAERQVRDGRAGPRGRLRGRGRRAPAPSTPARPPGRRRRRARSPRGRRRGRAGDRGDGRRPRLAPAEVAQRDPRPRREVGAHRRHRRHDHRHRRADEPARAQRRDRGGPRRRAGPRLRGRRRGGPQARRGVPGRRRPRSPA